jgi:hypothetical protein
MDYKDLWPAIQNDILGCIAADPLLGPRIGYAMEPGDVESVINMKLAKAIGAGLDGKNGVGYLVLPIERADDDNVNIPGGPLKLTISIQWVENVVINQGPTGTGTPIRVYAAWTEKLLKLYTPVGLTQSLVPARPVISEFTDNTNKNLRVGMVEFTAMEADFRPFARVNRPGISVSGTALQTSPNSYQLIGSNITLVSVSAPDADAGQIYYTTDNSHPYQGNAKAQVYTGPVTVTQPCLFRARAFAHNKAGSDTAAVNFWS